MRDFETISRDLGLKRFLGSPSGTLYFMPGVPYKHQDRAIMVRHFDGALPVASIPAYVDIPRAAQAWLARHPELAAIIRVEQPIEAGVDFVARRHHYYIDSLGSYDPENEDAPEMPAAVPALRATFAAACGRCTDETDRIIEAVLARSILAATGKTYFDGAGRFRIVELAPTAGELNRWAALISPA